MLHVGGRTSRARYSQQVPYEDQGGNFEFHPCFLYSVGVLGRHFFLLVLPFLIIILLGT